MMLPAAIVYAMIGATLGVAHYRMMTTALWSRILLAILFVFIWPLTLVSAVLIEIWPAYGRTVRRMVSGFRR